MIMVTTSAGRHQHQQAFKTILADSPALQQHGMPRSWHALPAARRPTRNGKRTAAGAIEIHQDDADDQRGFDAFAESYQESGEHKFPVVNQLQLEIQV